MSGALAVGGSGVTASAIGSIGSASSDRFITVFAGTIVIVNSTTSAGSVGIAEETQAPKNPRNHWKIRGF